MNLKISDSEMGSDATQERGGFPATSRDTLATVVEDGAEATALAYVEALDGAERKLLRRRGRTWSGLARSCSLPAARRPQTGRATSASPRTEVRSRRDALGRGWSTPGTADRHGR